MSSFYGYQYLSLKYRHNVVIVLKAVETIAFRKICKIV